MARSPQSAPDGAESQHTMSNFKYESRFEYDASDPFGHMQEEFPEESEFDVVIIGAGPNGLIAGAYLASPPPASKRRSQIATLSPALAR